MPAVMGRTLLERFPINLPDRAVLYAETHKASRPGGRRVLVKSAAGAPLFDSDDCFDLANALNRLEWWLAEKVLPVPDALRVRFRHGWIPPRPSVEDIYYQRWISGKWEQQNPAA